MIRHRHLLFLLPFFVLFLPASSLSQCLAHHRDALLRLKGGFVNSSLSWTPDTDCCGGWDGVTCDNRTGEVTALDLSERFLKGMVDPDALFNLTSLTSLNLAFNNLNFSEVSSKTPGFGALQSLTTLNLSYSGFTGQIPMGVASLTNLVALDFSIQYFPGTVWLGNPNLRTLIRNLTRLEALYLDGVDFTTDAHSWFDSLSEYVPKIQKLSLSNCNISGGHADASTRKLAFLTVLRLDFNRFSSEVPKFVGDLPLLQVLSLRYNNLIGSLPEAIYRLRNLTSLDASNNPQLGGSLSESIGNLGSLERLILSNCGLSGLIPVSIARLARLAKLDLSHNSLTGELPGFDVNSTNLSEIRLSNNNLNGSIPLSYGGLPNLTLLDLQRNSLTGPIPLSLFNLPLLKTLDLQGNKLSGGLEDMSEVTSSLETLDLSGNNLQGQIPSSISKLSRLKILTIAGNNFTGTISLSLLQGFPNLSSLDFSYNNLNITDYEVASSFPNISSLNLASCNIVLVHLDLSANYIAGTIPRWLWSIGGDAASLNHLNLSYNMLSGFDGILPNLSNTSLEVIDLHNNSLGGPIPIPPASSLVIDYSNNNFLSMLSTNIDWNLDFIFFSVSNNRLHGNIPPSICHSSFLQVLDLSFNNFNGSIPSCLAQMNELHVLNLRGNSLGGFLPSNFDTKCNLRILNLNNNRLEGELPVTLSNCTMLEVLDVGYNQLDGEFPWWLGNLTGMRVLVLRSNKFSGPVKVNSSSNGSFSMMQIMDLSSNGFNGSLSSKHFQNMKAMMRSDDNASQPAVQFKYLSLLQLYYQDSVTITSKGQDMKLVKILRIYTSIDISNNNFNGEIPDAIGKLNALKVLNMSWNLFTGQIPNTFGQLIQLESLDLSWNRISGKIPNELINLSFLSSLNLSYNNFSGRISQGRQFSTFSDASFLGNPDLCGAPLQKCSSSTSTEFDAGTLHYKFQPNLEFLFIGLGFVYGFALVVVPLLLSRKWRCFFYHHADKFLPPDLLSFRRR